MSNRIILPEMEKNIGRNERIVSMVSGSYLLYKAVSGKSPVKALTAAWFLCRGATGFSPLYKALNIDTSKPAGPIHIETYVTINKPREEVYAFWRKFDNLPLFMEHLESVTLLDEERSDWKAKIPRGTINWRSEVTAEIVDELISWKSLPGSEIEHAGEIRFSDAGKYGTEVHLEMFYNLPGNHIGENVGKLLNPLLEEVVKEDLRNFRRYMETGEIPSIKGQASGRNK